jgi:hypothetical protein
MFKHSRLWYSVSGIRQLLTLSRSLPVSYSECKLSRTLSSNACNYLPMDSASRSTRLEPSLTPMRNSTLAQHSVSYATYLITLLTYLLTPWSRVLLEKLTGFQLVKKFPAFYGTRRFITSARHLSLSWAMSIQSIPPHPTFWRPILILSSHLRLGLPSGLFHSGLPIKTLYTLLLSPYELHAPLISFNPGPIKIKIIIIFINCNWVDTRWQWLFYMYTKYDIGYY